MEDRELQGRSGAGLEGLDLEGLKRKFQEDGYICGEDVLVPVYLALKLGKPLLVEGEPGVGKTEIAKVLSRVFSTELIRLQCYEGLDENKALYEWNYQRQLLKIQLSREQGPGAVEESDLFSEEYLLERPLLRALRAPRRPVLLIDEVDKCDEEFEAFLFEVLSDFQVSVPELGTIAARQVPVVVLTSNRARELSDGLKRRCIFLYIDFPSLDKELKIIESRVPGISRELALEVARAMQHLRSRMDFRKKPSVAETLDWARALMALGSRRLTPSLVERTLSLVLKNKEDLDAFHQGLGAAALIQAAAGPDAAATMAEAPGAGPEAGAGGHPAGSRVEGRGGAAGSRPTGGSPGGKARG
ncbi:MAG: MoxR family ATPase [Acetobacteraceae bacterium]|nr:MoxR family ATPase [Acetobacteraceae bacterium]